MPNEYLGDWQFPKGTIPVYTNEYMPPDKLYIVGLPEEEPSQFLVSFTGAPLSVRNFRNLRKIGIVHPQWQEQKTITVIDYTEHDSS